jgi:hypothetical protein
VGRRNKMTEPRRGGTKPELSGWCEEGRKELYIKRASGPCASLVQPPEARNTTTNQGRASLRSFPVHDSAITPKMKRRRRESSARATGKPDFWFAGMEVTSETSARKVGTVGTHIALGEYENSLA